MGEPIGIGVQASASAAKIDGGGRPCEVWRKTTVNRRAEAVSATAQVL